MSGMRQALTERFWSKVQKTDGCWIWIARKDVRGYGRFMISGENRMAHRTSWVLTHGEIPSGLFALHKCDNPSCVNPDHLFLGTYSDNARDRNAKGRAVWQTKPHLLARGERHGQSKMTAEKVNEMRRLFKLGHTIRNLAKQFGLSFGGAKDILDRTNWKHLP